MKKLISLALFIVVSLTFTTCKIAGNHAPSAKIYYDYLVSLGEIETESSSTTGGDFERWDVYKLYYFLDDFNLDGILDLAISNEKVDSNGIVIYSYENGQVKKLFSKGMPYSAGTEIFTLAKYNNAYGIKYHRSNSVGDFTFFSINKDATIEEVFSGRLYDIDGNALDTSTSYDKMDTVTFYSIEELKKMF